MIGRRVSMLIGLVMLAASTFYLFAYLYWWEWNHALLAGVFVLAIEIVLLNVMVLGRLSRLESGFSFQAQEQRAATQAILRDTAPQASDTFGWLREGQEKGLGIFVPVLLGAGVILSAIAWVVERFARLMGGPTLERELSGRLQELSPPPHGFLATDADPLALLRRPVRR